MTPELVKHTISLIPETDTETLAHTWKVYHTSDTKNKLLDPLLKAIEVELRKRTKPIKETIIEETTDEQPDLYPDTDIGE